MNSTLSGADEPPRPPRHRMNGTPLAAANHRTRQGYTAIAVAYALAALASYVCSVVAVAEHNIAAGGFAMISGILATSLASHYRLVHGRRAGGR